MNKFYFEGEKLRNEIKQVVLSYMRDSSDCAPTSSGMKCAEIFRECGLDWGDYPNATSSNQQYWMVALLRELEKEKLVIRDSTTKFWRIV